MPSIARRTKLQSQLDGMDDLYLEHRVFGHATVPDTVEHRGREIVVVRKCSCGVRKRYWLDASRGRVRRVRTELDYSGAPGYLLEGLGRPDRVDREVILTTAVERMLS
jgi:hypothetical protein